MGSSDRDEADLGGLLSRLHTLLLSTADLESYLEGLAGLASTVITPAPACGITTRYDGRPTTAASSDERASLIDEHQYTLGEGPCLHAMATGDPVEVIDQAHDARWPAYREKANELGVRWSLSIPLVVQGSAIGALNLYGFECPDALGPAERSRVERFAEQAATGIALAIRQNEQVMHAEQLERALVSRSVIDQAIGVLMAQERCSSERAFDLLRHHSQNTNQKLREVATAVVTRLTGHPPASGQPFQARDHAQS